MKHKSIDVFMHVYMYVHCFVYIQVWSGPLSGNRVVVVLWNRGTSKATLTAYWSDVGLKPSIVVDARDVWEVRFYFYNSNYFWFISFKSC